MLNERTLLTATVALGAVGVLELAQGVEERDLGVYTLGCLGVLCAMHAASLLLG